MSRCAIEGRRRINLRKFLEIQDLEALNQSLVFHTSDCTVEGRVELYTTKVNMKLTVEGDALTTPKGSWTR